VSQLDANIIDQEVYEILTLQFNKIFTFFSEKMFEKYKPELSLLLQMILFRLSIWSFGSTHGYQLQNLKFNLPNNLIKKRTTLICYFFLDCLLPYIIKRLSIFIQPWALETNESQKKKFWKLLVRIEEIIKVLKLINFVVFLYDGKYVTLVHRLLSLKVIPLQHTARMISFDYLNRQLIWNGFTEFMLFIVPKININYIKDKFSWLRYGNNNVQNRCELCGEKAINPHVDEDGNCRHLFCYWCIQVKIIEQEKHTCTSCGNTITKITQLEL